jgi:hypothetical protein
MIGYQPISSNIRKSHKKADNTGGKVSLKSTDRNISAFLILCYIVYNLENRMRLYELDKMKFNHAKEFLQDIDQGRGRIREFINEYPWLIRNGLNYDG